MNVNLLIDAIVRQTMVLIAQLATTAGIRAPLAHVANQVFVDLVRELREQRVGNKVIADMFGLALSTYHAKVRRLSESSTDRGRSLWEVVLEFVRAHDTVSQRETLLRFRHDDETIVRGVLNDLVESGLVFRTGRGSMTHFRATREHERPGGDRETEAATNLVWLAVHRQGPARFERIAETIPLDSDELQRLLDDLVAGGRVERVQSGATLHYRAAQCVIALGDEAGWEAAVFDHYQAMVTAVCTKLRRDGPRSQARDVVGGSTYGYTVWDGHPLRDEVLGFLARVRSEAVVLRDKVHRYNSANSTPVGGAIGVINYVGQTVIEPDQLGGES